MRWTTKSMESERNRGRGSCKDANSQAGRQCTREGAGTGSLGLVTTLALLLIWRNRVERQGDKTAQGRSDTRLSGSRLLAREPLQGGEWSRNPSGVMSAGDVTEWRVCLQNVHPKRTLYCGVSRCERHANVTTEGSETWTMPTVC